MASQIAEALKLIESNRELADFVGPRDEELVREAEMRIGTSFPPSYRTFLLKLGMGSFGAEEFAGVVDERFQALWPDAVGLYLKAVEEGLPSRYFPFYSWGDGTLSALDLERRDEYGESPVVSCHDGRFTAAPVEDEDVSFATFLFERVRDELDE
jgi:antitoxin YobK